jgi:hypothetical protein
LASKPEERGRDERRKRRDTRRMENRVKLEGRLDFDYKADTLIYKESRQYIVSGRPKYSNVV